MQKLYGCNNSWNLSTSSSDELWSLPVQLYKHWVGLEIWSVRGREITEDGKVLSFCPPPQPPHPSVISCCRMEEVENMCNAWCRRYLAPLSCSDWLQMHEVVASLSFPLSVSLGVTMCWCVFIFRDSLCSKAAVLFSCSSPLALITLRSHWHRRLSLLRICWSVQQGLIKQDKGFSPGNLLAH